MAEDEQDETEPQVGLLLKAALALAALSIVLTLVLTGLVHDVHHRADAVTTELDHQRLRRYGISADDSR